MGCQCEKKYPQETQWEFIDRVIQRYQGQKGALIPILHAVQQKIGHLSEEVQTYIAQKMQVPLSEVYGIVSFYTLFCIEPKGKHKISVCLGTACYVRGAGFILDELEKQLGIRVGETTPDGLFTLEACRCLGACGLAPVLMVDDNVHSRLTLKDIPEIIHKYKFDE